MKYCPKCGSQNGDNAQFCANCGVTFNDQQNTYAQANTNAQAQGFVQPIPVGGKRLASNDAINALKLTGSGGGFLTIAIAYSVSVLITLVNLIYGIIPMLEMASYIPPGIIISNVAGGVIGLAISGVILAAFWMIYSEARKQGNSFKTAGLSIFSVFLWIAFAFICLAGFVAIVLSLIGGIANDEIGVGILILFIALLILAPLLLYYIFAVKSVSNAKKTAKTGIVAGRASVYVAVVNIILAVFAFISLFTSASLQDSVGNLLYYDLNMPDEVVAPIMSLLGGGGFLMILTYIISIVIYIASAVVIFNYNSKINSLKYQNAAPYAKPAYRPNANPYSNGVQQPTQPIPPVNPPQDTNNTL